MINANELQQQCIKGYHEELWIDFIFNHLPTVKRQQLEQHLPSCIACRELVEQWGELLADRSEIQNVTVPHPSISMRAEKEASNFHAYELSERRLQSLQRFVRKQAIYRQLKKNASGYRFVIAGAVAAIMLLVLPIMGLKSSLSTPEHVDQYVQYYEPAAISFMNEIDSARYRVETAEGQASSGYIWLKQDGSEAFLWLENLQQIGLNDYQAWAVSGEGASSLGIIKVVGTEGHLYITPPSSLRPSDLLTLTVEPKGGSLTPTSKPIMLIVKQ